MFYFTIIGTDDNPIYEAEFSTPKHTFQPEIKELNPYIVHSTLDIMEYLQWQRQPHLELNANSGGFLRSRHNSQENSYLGKVDSFYGLAVSGFLTYGNMKFIMVHGNGIVDDTITRSFFYEVYELYLKTLMNPFYKVNDPISSPAFDSKVRVLSKRLFP
ncbi:unnamed protein product [Kluyveromyces dobzhanskii CBS 2104]|uniref:WGS project CCBQ000000000 data, contig 00102 n=1 Tax=Kluyveromyces dobzhanskii CBS 2104 TaxID=1427455 RepID=A0A0A8L6S0_9SACH|nr:unnamed protein product [Kluyveromyces dobzhanskii CBS 2104]